MAKRKQSSRNEDAWKKIFEGLHSIIESQEKQGQNLLKIYKADYEYWFSSMKLLQDQISEMTREAKMKDLQIEELSQQKNHDDKLQKDDEIKLMLEMHQKKKIFISGLGNRTKEEDVRKVFEEVGEIVKIKLTEKLKSKGRYGFITFASADLANLALTKYQNVKICGRQCHTAAMERIDAILLDNVDKKWNKEHVVEFLQRIGIEKIDEVLVVADPDNAELNRGFALLNFETKKDAQLAYNTLQNENAAGKHSCLKVSWASQLVDPVEEEENHNDHLPDSPQKRSRQSWGNQRRKAYHSKQSPQKLSFSSVRKPPKKSKITIGKHKNLSSSWKQGGPSSTAGYHQPLFGGKQPVTELSLLYHHDPRAHHQSHVQVSNVTQHRPLAIVTPFRRHDQQEYAHYTSFPRHDQERAHYTSFPRHDQGRVHYTSFPHHDWEHAQYTSGSLNIAEPDPRYFQIRDQTAYHGSSSVYRRMP